MLVAQYYWRVKNMTETLKCGCKVEDGKFVLGNGCKERNCGECRLLVKLHPFGNKRVIDFMFDLK